MWGNGEAPKRGQSPRPVLAISAQWKHRPLMDITSEGKFSSQQLAREITTASAAKLQEGGGGGGGGRGMGGGWISLPEK